MPSFPRARKPIVLNHGYNRIGRIERNFYFVALEIVGWYLPFHCLPPLPEKERSFERPLWEVRSRKSSIPRGKIVANIANYLAAVLQACKPGNWRARLPNTLGFRQ